MLWICEVVVGDERAHPQSTHFSNQTLFQNEVVHLTKSNSLLPCPPPCLSVSVCRTPHPTPKTRVDRGLPDDSFCLLKPGESWRVGERRHAFLDHYRHEPRRPLSH